MTLDADGRIEERGPDWRELLAQDLDKRMLVHQRRITGEYGHRALEMDGDQVWSHVPIHHCI